MDVDEDVKIDAPGAFLSSWELEEELDKWRLVRLKSLEETSWEAQLQCQGQVVDNRLEDNFVAWVEVPGINTKVHQRDTIADDELKDCRSLFLRSCHDADMR